jgi:acetyltransferase-like isoleucine patch superfamily enzyme
MKTKKIKFTQHPFKVQLFEGLFQFAWGCIKYIPTPLGDPIRSLFLRLILKKSRVPALWVRCGVDIWWPRRIEIGVSCINENVFFNGFGGVKIGDHCLIGRGTSFFSGGHIFSNSNVPVISQGLVAKPISVGDDVYFGLNCVILGGVTIASGAVIAAGSVVVSDVPSNAVVAGSPAKIIRYRNDIKDDISY